MKSECLCFAIKFLVVASGEIDSFVVGGEMVMNFRVTC